jgi:REG-2-like HAD superfamily hydrolase
MSRPITAVLFDAGFTLLDLVAPVADVYFGAAREIGAELDASAFDQALKRHWAHLEKDHRKKNPDLSSSEEFERSAWHSFTAGLAAEFPSLHACHADWHLRLVKHFDDPAAWRPVPSAIETLQMLRANGLRLAVVSNWHSALGPILAARGFSPLLSFILTSAEAGRKKPHREIFELALSRLGVAANQTAHVGDSWTDDILGARAAGLAPIYFHRLPTDPPCEPGVHLICRLDELPLLFTRLADP